MKKIVLLVTLMLSALLMSQTTLASTSDIVGPSIIHKQANHILTISNILRLYSSPYGNVAVQSDEFTGQGNVLGEHQIVLKVTDGDETYLKDISVFVIAELGNVKAVTDRKDLHVRTTQQLTPHEIVEVLQKTGYVEITATTQMMIINDTYTENNDVEGQYIFEFRLINSAGVDEVYTSLINVSDTDGFFVPDIVFEKPISGTWAWIQNAWTNWVWPILYNLIMFLVLGIAAIFLIRYYKKKNRGSRA